ncbi:hypothetical protein ACTJJ0_32650 [Chitinophaga sp. 22321]|uniref:Uncharacterized protein n=1 Tax=Chitinophaga hostae TaxID=2831022 RepID=A0ABS5J9A3_9BACT|nr:hypothetical protein [Chitinophaga hostae]MBS0031788.1 hypothetical protein [Chitinophaga hostae]
MMDKSMVEQQLSLLSGINWDDLQEVERSTTGILQELATHKSLLSQFIAAVETNNTLMELSEYDAVLIKLVLFDDRGIRLRLHIFKDDAVDRAHNHRWTFAGKVLKGGYKHILYSTEKELSTALRYTDLKPVVIRYEKAGDGYCLHHSFIHTLHAEADGVSLIIRGPSLKEKMIILDKDTGESWWQYGAANDLTAAHKKNAKITLEEYKEIVSFLREHNLMDL